MTIPDNQLEDICSALDRIVDACEVCRAAVDDLYDEAPKDRELDLSLDIDEIMGGIYDLQEATP